MATTNPFEQFQIKPTTFKTKTTNPALNAISAPVATTQTPVKLPSRLSTSMQKLGTKITPEKTVDQTKTTVTKPTAAPQASLGTETGTPVGTEKATTGGTPPSTVPSGEEDANTYFDYTGYGDTPTGPITDEELTNWTGESRNQYNTLTKNEQAAKAQLDYWRNVLSSFSASPQQKETARTWITHYQQQLDDIAAEKETLVEQFRSDYATDHAGDRWLDTMSEIIKNWGTSYTNDTTVKPFESEWSSIFGEAFGDLSELGSSTDFLESFMNNFGLDDIVTGQVNWGDYGFENYTPDALLKFIEDGSNIPGFEWKEGDPNISNEQEFIKFIMNEAKAIRDKVANADWTTIFGEVGQEMGERMKAALNLINSPGLTPQERDAIIKRNMATVTRDAEAQKREYDLMIGTQLAGQSTKSAHYRRLVDRDLMMARAQVEGDLTELDINLRQQNYQKGLEELGNISRDKMDAMLQSMQIAGTREGQVLNFLSQVGQIAVGSKETEYSHYENKLKMAQDFYLQNSERILKEELGKAELDLKNYDITTQAGLESMRLAYQTALQNRGMNIDEAKANADQLLETYKIGQSFAQMDINKLTTIADLAAKAQEGDRQAWGAYQSMMLEERLKNRGMNIEEAQSLAQLTFGIWQTEKQQALTMWVEKYRGQLARELAQFEADNQPSPWLQAVGSLFGGIGNIIPFLKRKPGNGIADDNGSPLGDYPNSGGDNA